MTEMTKDGSVIDASGTKATPSGKCSAADAATLSASRVLPTPPGPVSVRSGTSLPNEQCADHRQFPLASNQRGAGQRQVENGRLEGNEAVMAPLAEDLTRTGDDSAVP